MYLGFSEDFLSKLRFAFNRHRDLNEGGLTQPEVNMWVNLLLDRKRLGELGRELEIVELTKQKERIEKEIQHLQGVKR